MPLFEYRCQKCVHFFEELIFRRDEVVHCPRCGATEVAKQMSVCAIKTSKGFTSSAGSSCDTCSATSCATCSSASGFGPDDRY